VEHDVPTGLLDVANVQVDRVVDELRRIAASGRLITIEDIVMMLLGAELKNVDRQRELLAVLLAVTLQRLAWQ
jgi:protein gp37